MEKKPVTSSRKSKKRRKRLRLISDDSVFIPISDSMMEDVGRVDKENIPLPEQKSDQVTEEEVVSEVSAGLAEWLLCFFCDYLLTWLFCFLSLN